jgi:Rap1a immunity proteins
MEQNAHAITGKELIEFCESKQEDLYFGFCTGYISGYMSIYSIIQSPKVYPWEEGDKNKFPKTCMPEHITISDLQTTLLAYPLRFEPRVRLKLLEFDAWLLLGRTIQNSWPCKNSGK